MSEHDPGGPGKDGSGAVKERTRTKRPPLYKVILHNDDYTTQEWVVHILRDFFNKSHPESVHIMLTVHHSGMAVVGVYSRDIAESLVENVTKASRGAGYPLLITFEPE